MFSPLGGHVSPSVTPLTHLWHVPAGDLAAYSGLVLTQVGYNCGSRPVSTQGGAVVIGDGLVGHWAAQYLSARGARVLLVGRHDSRLAKFHGTGRHTVNSSQEDWIAVVRELFPSGASVMVDTAGDTGLPGQFARLAARNGEFVSAGFYGLNDTISLQSLRVNEISIHAVSGWEKKRMDATVEYIRAGVLETMPLVTHRFPAERAASAWDAINGDRENVLGVLLDW
jgi:threonine dehydrogenase-like Zn-dependent dehydrogenase